MKAAIYMLKWTSYSTAIGSVTMTPLMGFVVGDKRPSIAATALQMFIAVIFMLAALVATAVQQFRRRRVLVAKPVSPSAARRQAHDVGLPWLEADGSVSWPADQAPRTTSPKTSGGAS